jgi:hypothetical protein
MTIRAHRVPVLPQPGNRRKSSRWPALTVLCVSILIVNLDSTVLNVALPTLVRDLHATSHRLSCRYSRNTAGMPIPACHG